MNAYKTPKGQAVRLLLLVVIVAMALFQNSSHTAHAASKRRACYVIVYTPSGTLYNMARSEGATTCHVDLTLESFDSTGSILKYYPKRFSVVADRNNNRARCAVLKDGSTYNGLERLNANTAAGAGTCAFNSVQVPYLLGAGGKNVNYIVIIHVDAIEA